MGKGSTNYGITEGNSQAGPWQPQQAPIQQGINRASTVFGSSPTVDPLITQGIGGIEQAANSSTLPGTAASFLTNTLTNPNPNAYIDDLSMAIGNKVVPDVMSKFALSGRSGDSPLAQGAVAEGIATSLAPYMFGSAENQQNRQMDALALSPTIEAARYGPSQALVGAGQMRQEAPYSNIGNFMNIVGQPYGSSSSYWGQAPIDQAYGLANGLGLRAAGK